MRVRWSQFGAQGGVALAVGGLLLIFLGWNGAASYDRVPSQFPYLISGGIAGLALVIIGAALMVTQSLRQDRAALIDAVAELRDAVERSGGGAAAGGDGGITLAGSMGAAAVQQAEAAGLVVAGPSSYHRPSCRLLDGRGHLPTLTRDAARGRDLAPCRVCSPDDLTVESEVQPAAEGTRRRRGRTRTGT